MTTPARRPKVFLSYTPEEAAHAARLRPLLEIAGFAPRLDSEALAREAQWDAALAFTMTSTDFVVALLSRGTRGSRQEQELLCAFRIVAKLGANTSSIFPVLVDSTQSPLDEVLPAFFKPLNVVAFADFDSGWRQLHRSLSKAARSAGLRVPRLLRAAPCGDVDQAAASETINAHRFFSRSMNASGGGEVAELTLIANGRIVEDRTHARMWTAGCLDPDALPRAPLADQEEEVARWTPDSMQTEAQRALIAARLEMKHRLRLAIEEFTGDFNSRRAGGYDGWRLPTLEEAMSLVTRATRRDGRHISELFSDHVYVRTADFSPGPAPLMPGLSKVLFQSIWVVSYLDGDCFEVAEEAPIPLRLVRTHLD